MNAAVHPSATPRKPAAYYYRTKAGDTPRKIGQEVYGIQDSNGFKWLEEQLAAQESGKSGLYDGQYLKPGQSLVLSAILNTPPPPPMCQASPEYIGHMLQSMPVEERDGFIAAAWLQQNWNILSATGATGLGAGSFLLSPANAEDLRGIARSYDNYKAGKITKGQYDYDRRTRIARFRARVGPVERLLFPGKTPSEVIRISRSKVIPATAPVLDNVARLQNIGRYASRGGAVLSVAGLGMGCKEIANASGRTEKNKIFAEASMSFLVGTISSAALAVTLAATPIGWVVALGLAAGTAASSIAAGKVAAKAYDRYGREIDLTEMLGVNRVCR